MFAQLVFDLPLAGPFDYLVPSNLESQIAVGSRVQVFLGTRKCVGFVIGLMDQSLIENLKPIKSLVDEKPILDQAQIALAHELSRYYGCSLGEALFTITRGCQGQQIAGNAPRTGPSSLSLHLVPSGHYEQVLLSLIKPLAEKKERALILVADQFVASAMENIVKKHFLKESYLIGTRSLVFRSLADISLVIMIDEEDPSYKQEQTPMYETRDVLLMRSRLERINIAFVSSTPSVEMMSLVNRGQIKKFEQKPAGGTGLKPVHVQVIDLNNYKFTPKGLISPPVINAIEKNLATQEKTIVVLNRKGSYALSRCKDCGFVLKCQRCDAPMMYSRLKTQYQCHYCSFSLPQETNCPQCQKPSWKSIGIGVEQVQRELKNTFGKAEVACFERGTEKLKDFNILITTQAVLRFKYQWKVNTIILIDFDSQLNRMDRHSSFRSWSLTQHFRSMAKKQLFIQTRDISHYVIKALVQDDGKFFYNEEMNIRKELELSPFGHEVAVCLRSKNQVAAQQMAQEFYELLKNKVEHLPSTDMVSKKRDQYRFNILVRGEDVIDMIAKIKTALGKLKRRSNVIVTLNVDA